MARERPTNTCMNDGRVSTAAVDPSTSALRLLGDTEAQLLEWNIEDVKVRYTHTHADLH